MIHTEAWYRESDVGGMELRRLQEQALRGGMKEKEELLRYYIRVDMVPSDMFTLDTLMDFPELGTQLMEEGLIHSRLSASWLWPLFWDWVTRHDDLRDVQFQALVNCPEEHQPQVTFYHVYEVRASDPGNNGYFLSTLDRGYIGPEDTKVENITIQKLPAREFVQVLGRVLLKGGDEWQNSPMDTYVEPPKREDILDAVQAVEDEWPYYAPVRIEEQRFMEIEEVAVPLESLVYPKGSSRWSRWTEWLRTLGNSVRISTP